MTKSEVLACENRRGAAGAPQVVEPAAVPVPLATAPVQAQHAAAAERVTEDRSIEEDVGRVAVGRFVPARGDEVLVLPQRLEHLGVQADAAVFLQALQLLFANDVGLALLQHRFEADLAHVHFGDVERALVFFDDGPAFADELGGVELGRAVDGDDLRFADDDASAVLEEGGELASRIAGVVDDLLQDGSGNRVPFRIVHQDADGVQNLTRGGLVHLGIS